MLVKLLDFPSCEWSDKGLPVGWLGSNRYPASGEASAHRCKALVKDKLSVDFNVAFGFIASNCIWRVNSQAQLIDLTFFYILGLNDSLGRYFNAK